MSQIMKAPVKRKAETGIWMEQVPAPEVGPNEVLIKVDKTVICDTDAFAEYIEMTQMASPASRCTRYSPTRSPSTISRRVST